MKNLFKKITLYSGLIFIILMVIGLIYFFTIGIADRTYQLTSESFDKIEFLNSEFYKLQDLRIENIKTNSELKFAVRELIAPEYFDEYPFLKFYILDFDLRYQDVTQVKQYFSSLMLPDEVIAKLSTQKDISYDSETNYVHNLRKVIGIDTYDKFNQIITAVTDDKPTWEKYTTKLLFWILPIFFILTMMSESSNKSEEAKKLNKELDEKIENAELVSHKEPRKITPTWDIANSTLQKYYNNNLSQVRSIYNLSIVVMLVGFLLIIYVLLVLTDSSEDIKIIGVVAGVITEFIGATFLFIYKSTITQALQHSKSLEEINKVGVSIKLIDSIEYDENNKGEINKTKLEIAKFLISNKRD